MYNNMVGHMQSNLAGYMESVQQGASQKKINRPSDDPAGTYRVLTTRQDMVNTAQYQENVDTAKGWMELADNVLSTQLPVAIQGLKTLAEQASTGTYTAEQRRIMADQARQYFGQILNLANTEFEGKSIFSGHKYTQNAFQEGLAVTPPAAEDWQEAVKNGQIDVAGASATTIIVQFTNTAEQDLAAGATYRWTDDGGATWNEAQVLAGENGALKLEPEGKGVTMTIKPDADGNLPKLAAYDPEIAGPASTNGSLLYLRPTAVYKGDDNDQPFDINVMGAGSLTAGDIQASGEIGQNTLIRFDDAVEPGKDFYWSYSVDGGTSWITAKGTAPAAGEKLRLPIPGGYLDAETPADGSGIPKDAQILVHPARADLGYEIMKDTYLPVNSVGKDVFGGYYEGKPALNGENNLFEVVGKFIGYLEGNNQSGCQETLVALTTAEKQILAEATRIGGMENRISMAADVLSFQQLDQQERLSYVEDIDLTELLTKLTRQQLTYQTVLQSSSMIMQMSLAKYL